MSEQLTELMLQLKKTTPGAARQILNSQPQIAYALISLMVAINAVDFNVFQKTLADFAATQPPQQQQQQPPPLPPPPAPPAPAMNHDILAAVPDDQKTMIIQVLSMTPEQLAMLPPQDRANIMQLKASFGL